MSVLFPAVVDVRVQVPAATVPVQVAAPSLTVTSPVGVQWLGGGGDLHPDADLFGE